LLKKLISINSENPGGNEFRIARFAGDYLARLGLKIQIYEFKEKRSNLIALLEGKNRRRSLLLTPHLDTVPCGGSWTKKPFAEQSSRRLYGWCAPKEGDLPRYGAVTALCRAQEIEYNLILPPRRMKETGSHLGIIPLLAENASLNPDTRPGLDSDDSASWWAEKSDNLR